MTDTKMTARRVSLSPDMASFLALMAEQYDSSQSEIVRRALREWFTVHGFPYVYLPPRDPLTGRREGDADAW